ncbi:TolC family protein [Desulfobacter sp.]|uniref:TolC family protein n=1 Tax=Desulfobacter sp. TaxID=2294 RepID=UPI003D15339A
MMRYALISVVLMSFFYISGCNLISPDPGAVMPVEMPDAYVHQTNTGTSGTGEENPDGGWWLGFGVDELSKLIQTGLGANYDLKVLKAKADQALADVKSEKSNFWPSLDYSLGGKRTHSRSKTEGRSAISDHDHTYSASLDAGYAPDLWGKTRANVNARELEYLAARQNLEDGALTLSTDIAGTWVDILSVRTRMAVLTRQIEANRMTLKLQELRFTNGRATALDVSQQREALAQVLSAMPLLEKEEKQLVNAMGLYLGQTPGTSVAVSAPNLPQTFLNAYIELLGQQLTAVKATLQDARVQYLNGQSSYLNYLSAWASMESLERQLISEQATYVKERIALYKATGWRGSFFQAPPTRDNHAGTR